MHRRLCTAFHSFPLFKSRFSTVLVPAHLPGKRVAFLKPVPMINAMEDEKEDIFATSMSDRYNARPNNLEECCLAHFAISYTTSYSTIQHQLKILMKI